MKERKQLQFCKKTLVLLIIVCGISTVAKGQFYPRSPFYGINKTEYSPALIAPDGKTSIGAIYFKNLISNSQSGGSVYHNANFFFEKPLSKNSAALGINGGYFTQTGRNTWNLSFAIRKKLFSIAKANINLGFKAGLIQYIYNAGFDPLNILRLGFGGSVTHENYYFSASLLTGRMNALENQLHSKFINVAGSYKFQINKDISLTPHLLTQTTLNSYYRRENVDHYSLSFIGAYKEIAKVGIGFHQQNLSYASILGGVNLGTLDLMLIYQIAFDNIPNTNILNVALAVKF